MTWIRNSLSLSCLIIALASPSYAQQKSTPPTDARQLQSQSGTLRLLSATEADIDGVDSKGHPSKLIFIIDSSTKCDSAKVGDTVSVIYRVKGSHKTAVTIVLAVASGTPKTGSTGGVGGTAQVRRPSSNVVANLDTPPLGNTSGTTGHTATTTPSHPGTAGSHTSVTTAGHGTTTTVSHAGSGRPIPAGSREIHTANGGTVRTHADGSRIVVENDGVGYVQRPFIYQGNEYRRRTYVDRGRSYDRFYKSYAYRGTSLDFYAPARYYSPSFYGWAHEPWAAPATYSWGWGDAPWYGYFGNYFTPYPVYPSASFWLTDYLIAHNLQAAYTTQASAQSAATATSDSSPITPDVKQKIVEEVRGQVALENAEADANRQSDPTSGSITPLLSDNRPHVYIVANDLNVVDITGRECVLSRGDVISVMSAPPPAATGATAVVLASKGGKDCPRSANITIAFNDLQDMQNNMRETIDLGMAELQSKQGNGGLPAAPPAALAPPTPAAFAEAAPPPDSAAAAEISQQAQAADQATDAPASNPASIALGQTIAQVTANLGPPKSIVALGARKIYVYKDLKITFKDGKVSDVQ